MSKQNNINPDHYKVSSHERRSNEVARTPQQSEIARGEARERWLERERKATEKGRAPKKA
jgi:hypothetical protein